MEKYLFLDFLLFCLGNLWHGLLKLFGFIYFVMEMFINRVFLAD